MGNRNGEYIYPRESDIDVTIGGFLPDSPVVSVTPHGDVVYVQVGHEDVGSLVIRMAGHVARQLGWALTQAAVDATRGASTMYVLTEKGREALDG